MKKHPNGAIRFDICQPRKLSGLAKRMRVEPENLIIQIMKRDNNGVVCMDNNAALGVFVS
jgi:hypothetical protein